MRTRGSTISRKELRRSVKRYAEELLLEEVVELRKLEAGWRPRTRGECEEGVRPCPYLGCRHHLALEVTGAGSIHFPFGPDFDLDELEETCVLDVADRGGVTLERAGELTGVCRERIRQIEERAVGKLQRRLAP